MKKSRCSVFIFRIRYLEGRIKAISELNCQTFRSYAQIDLAQIPNQKYLLVEN